MKITKRQLAARFVDALDTAPASDLATAAVEVAVAAGYDHDDLAELVGAVLLELQTRFGAAEVRLTTAHTLPADALEALAAKVAAAADLKHFSYTHTVNPDLLGGFEAQAGDLAFHTSIRDNLATFEVNHG
jgi:F0F1-type ATP synthase delta subunit